MNQLFIQSPDGYLPIDLIPSLSTGDYFLLVSMLRQIDSAVIVLTVLQVDAGQSISLNTMGSIEVLDYQL